MMEEIRASAHAAKTFSRLSISYLKMADEFPRQREHCLSESRRLREQAKWTIARAKRLKERAE